MTNNPGYLQRILSGTALSALLLFCPGCVIEDFKTAAITVHYSGDFNAGGCGWVMEKDSANWYQAVNLPSQYLVEGLPLKITYKQVQDIPNCTNSITVKGVFYLHKIENI